MTKPVKLWSAKVVYHDMRGQYNSHTVWVLSDNDIMAERMAREAYEYAESIVDAVHLTIQPMTTVKGVYVNYHE